MQRSPWSFSVLRPLTFLASALSFGCVLGTSFTPSPLIIVVALISMLTMIASAVVVHARWPDLALGLWCLMACVFGIVRASSALAIATAVPLSWEQRSPVWVIGVVTDVPQRFDWGERLDMRLTAIERTPGEEVQAQGGVRVSIPMADRDRSDAPIGMRGDRIRVQLQARPIREFKDPGAFSYRTYLLTRNIGATATARSAIEVRGRAWWAPLVRPFDRARDRVERSLAETLSPPQSNIVAALATGSREGLDDDIAQAFSLSGLTHLLSISGLHVAYVALIIAIIVRLTLGMLPMFLIRVPRAHLAAGISIPLVWLFVLFTGASVPAVRSGIMITVYLLGKMTGLAQDGLTSIAAAVLFILLVTPLAVLDVSFQLSVVAVMGIALIAQPLGALWQGDASSCGHRLVRALVGTLAVSLGATVATLPIVAWHFQVVSLLGLITNVVAVPLTGFLLQPAAMLGTIAALVTPQGAPLCWKIAGALAHVLMLLAQESSDRGAVLVVRWAPNVLEVLLCYAALIFVLVWWQFRRSPRMLAVSLLLAFSAMGWGATARALDHRLRVTFIDVGQGDAILVEFPDTTAYVIDGGGLRGSSIDVGRAAIRPLLLRRGISRLDAMILTHPHYDHYAGLTSLVEEFHPTFLYLNGGDAPAAEQASWQAFVQACAQGGVEMKSVRGDSMTIEHGGATLELIPPAEGAPLSDNDGSLVSRLRFGKQTFLMAADMSARAEEAFMRRFPDIRAEVLKVGHHGSRDATSRSWLARVQPKLAVISVGLGNRYRLPANETLARLEAHGVQLYRTDRDGAITMATDGEKLEVRTVVR